MAADTFDARPINVLRSRLAGLSSAWVLFLARISQEIIFNPQASAQVQRCHPGFLFRFLQCGAAAFGRTPLERPRGPRGRRGPTAPGTIPRESALGGAGHSAISRAASILVLFKLTHYPRVGCDSRGRLTLAKWGNRAKSVRGYLTLPIAFVRSSK